MKGLRRAGGGVMLRKRLKKEAVLSHSLPVYLYDLHDVYRIWKGVRT